MAFSRNAFGLVCFLFFIHAATGAISGQPGRLVKPYTREILQDIVRCLLAKIGNLNFGILSLLGNLG